MDLSSTISIIVGLLSIGTQVFIVGSMWGKIKQKDEEREKQIGRVENDFKEQVKDIKDTFQSDVKSIGEWIKDHDKYHREEDKELNKKISEIDKNVALMFKTVGYIEEEMKSNKTKC